MQRRRKREGNRKVLRLLFVQLDVPVGCVDEALPASVVSGAGVGVCQETEPMRAFWFADEVHSSFGEEVVALALVTGSASENNVFPS